MISYPFHSPLKHWSSDWKRVSESGCTMSSYKSDGGRIPRLRDHVSRRGDVTSPVLNSSSRTLGQSVALSSGPPFSKSMDSITRNSRSSLLSDAEGTSSPIASPDNSRTPTNNNVHTLLLPRATTHPLPSTLKLSSTKIAPARPTPRSAAAAAGKQPPEPTSERPPHVLRRRAPTIGQRDDDNITPKTATTRPEKLCVIIPRNTGPAYAVNGPPRPSWNPAAVAKQKPSPNTSRVKAAGKATAQAVDQGPRELASLRTTVKAQNLPPPTPVFASASSPSTGYSGSPGIWSRTSTPTSLSSYSPGIIHPAKQSTPQDDRMEPADGFPRMDFAAEPSMLSLKDKHDDPPLKDDVARASTPPATQVLPKATTRSSLPRMAKAIAAETAATDQEHRGRAVEDRRNRIATATRGVASDPGPVPPRPSREGTHQLELEPSPVIRSNLSPNTLVHKRRGSGASSITVCGNQLVLNPSAATSVDSLQSRGSSRLPALIPTSTESSRRSPQISIKEPKAKRDATSPAKSRRFGLFPKKSKSDLNGRKLETPPTRKGPAAGTGHEGYGRYAQRGRKTSANSNSVTRARSTSTNRSAPRSVSSSKGSGSTRSRPDLDLDDFLLERLEPVIITGGGMNGAALTKTQSGPTTSGLSAVSAPSPAKHQGINLAGHSTESLATTEGEIRSLYQTDSAFGSTHAKIQVSRPTQTAFSADKSTSMTGDLRYGESSHRPVIEYDESWFSLNSEVLQRGIETEPSAQQPKERPKKTKGLKWSFFQRSGNVQKKTSTPAIRETLLAPKLHATVSPISKSRPVAHYALVDTDSVSLEDIFRHVEESPPSETEDSGSSVEIPAALNIRKASILLPPPPKLEGGFCRDRPVSPTVFFNKDPLVSSPQQRKTDERPRRLASVGRIPEVVSRRDRQHKPVFESFSRPFGMADSTPLAAPVTDNPFDLQMPNQPGFISRPTKPASRPSGFGFDLTQPFGDPCLTSALDFVAGPYSSDEFLTFSLGQGAMLSTSGSGTLAAVTAVVPEPETDPTEDEIWGEYDDLIDHVIFPEIPTSDSPEQVVEEEKLGLVTMASKTLQAELSANFDRGSPVPLADTPAVAPTPPSPQPSNGSFRLRRSVIASALRSSIVPSSRPSLSDINASYCGVDAGNQSTSLAPVERQAAFFSSSSLNLSETFETCRQRNTVMFDIAERDREGPTAQTNIRSGSLMTSRWLSFGRVLFSPAHNHVKSGEQERILVIDGLGNDDWSFYCALTYPNADVYCLTDGPATTASKHPAAWQPPANHHTVYQASLEQQFPFAKGYFTVTVLRFPSVCSDNVQNNIVSECKRVLRPGGYMEMSLLDLDMVNMGIRTRKAVRSLKERTYLFDRNISLKPASDSIQKLLGRHGFDHLRRCMVRIPVTGVIVRSSASSSSTSSSDPSRLVATCTPSAPRNSSTSVPQPKMHGKSPSNDTDLSLGDLLSDSPSLSNDESIRKIVAKVGRWWYTRCYEIPVLPNGDAGLSIWADKRVLRECQKRGTGFRLLIAYAQKPSEVKRRTASV